MLELQSAQPFPAKKELPHSSQPLHLRCHVLPQTPLWRRRYVIRALTRALAQSRIHRASVESARYHRRAATNPEAERQREEWQEEEFLDIRPGRRVRSHHCSLLRGQQRPSRSEEHRGHEPGEPDGSFARQLCQERTAASGTDHTSVPWTSAD